MEGCQSSKRWALLCFAAANGPHRASRFHRFSPNRKADSAAPQLLEFLVFLVLASALFFCSEALSK